MRASCERRSTTRASCATAIDRPAFWLRYLNFGNQQQQRVIGEELMKSYRRLGAVPLAVLLTLFLGAPIAAQEQKGTLVFAVESLAAQTLDPIIEARPGNATYQ